MTADELIRALRNLAETSRFAHDDGILMMAADRLEEQEKIINQYHRADTFLNAHGWKWEDEKDADGT